MKLYIFRQFLCPSSGVYSLYTRHWYMSYRFEDTPRPPDLAPADFNLFPRLILVLKGRRSCDATDIMKNATEELKRFLSNCF